MAQSGEMQWHFDHMNDARSGAVVISYASVLPSILITLSVICLGMKSARSPLALSVGRINRANGLRLNL